MIMMMMIMIIIIITISISTLLFILQIGHYCCCVILNDNLTYFYQCAKDQRNALQRNAFTFLPTLFPHPLSNGRVSV